MIKRMRLASPEYHRFPMVRETAQDRSLSWAARGLLTYLLSQRDDWTVQPKDLEQDCGKDKVYSLLKELIKARYIKRTDVRDSQGKIVEWIYEVNEVPLPENPDLAKNPLPAKPDQAKPDSNKDSGPLSNSESLSSKVSESIPSLTPPASAGRQIKKSEAKKKTKIEAEKPKTAAFAPAYTSESVPEKDPPAPTNPPVASHLALRSAWIDIVASDGKLPAGKKAYTFSRPFKALAADGVTLEQMKGAAELYNAWHMALTINSPSHVEWTVGAVTNETSRALALHAEGITPSQVRDFVEAKYAETDRNGQRFWAGKIMRFEYVSQNIAIWLAQGPSERRIEDHAAATSAAKVRPAPASTNAYLADPYFADRDDDDDLPYAIPETVPRPINYTHAKWWTGLLGQLQIQLNRATFDTWLRSIELVEAHDFRWIVQVPHEYAKDWLERHLVQSMRQTLADMMRINEPTCTFDLVSINFEVARTAA